jgi:general secretion pathway protein G
MNRSAHRLAARGFTLIELLIALALIGLIASVALPLYEVTTTRMKEAELRQALRVIRNGLDAYKAAVDAGTLPRKAGESGYPASLDVLTEPIDIGASSNPNSTDGDKPQRIQFLRQLPRDPFYPDRVAPASQTWDTRSYASVPEDPQPGPDVFDVSSKSQRLALDGSSYRNW